jgi:hypothetical protein
MYLSTQNTLSSFLHLPGLTNLALLVILRTRLTDGATRVTSARRSVGGVFLALVGGL